MRGTQPTIVVAVALAAGFAARGARAQLPDSVNAGRSGVYRTAADFTAGRLDFAIDCKTQRHRIDRHTFLNRSYLDVTHEGQRTRVAKRDVYGYRECDGSVVRFDDGREYTVVAAGRGVMYARPDMVPQAKGFRVVPVYFFSRTPADTIRPLTRSALKDAFPDDHALHDRIDQTFRSDEELAAYDARHRQYRVLRFLAEALPANTARAP